MVYNRCQVIVETMHDSLCQTIHAIEFVPGSHRHPRFSMQRAGPALLEDKQNTLLQKIKCLIIAQARHADEPLVLNLSVLLSKKLAHDYTYMSNLFSDKLGITIEKFYICHKIERVKQLLLADSLTLTEIAYKLHYSSVAHLSNQFKKVTGKTTSEFKYQTRRVGLASEMSRTAWDHSLPVNDVTVANG